MDWNIIKAEYIAGGTSYRGLAKKYNVSFTTLTRTAQRENWVGLRKQAEDKAETKIVNVVSEKKVKIDDRFYRLVDSLMQKAEETIANTPVWTVNALKEMSTALKYLKECKGVKSEIDLREQEARIKNLEKQAMADSNELQEIHVTFGGASSEEVKEWAE